MTKALFFVILFTGMCWTEAGDAFEPWEGKAITVLNVRRSPGVDSQSIGLLNKGQTVTINDKKKKWYKIVFKVEGKRYRGWVHGIYIKGLSSEKVEISSALAKVRAGIAVEELQEMIPLDASEGEDHLPNGIEKELDKASTPAATHVVKEQARMAPQEGLLSGKKDVRDPLPEKAIAVREQARAASRTKPPAPKEDLSTFPAPATTLMVREQARAAPRTKPPAPKEDLSTSYAPATTLMVREQTRAASRTKSPAPKMEVSTSSPPPAITPVVSKRVDTLTRTIVPVVQKSLKQEPPASHDRKGLIDTQELKELAKLALRLLSVVLSCLAILFSYKAIKLAKISYNTAMQLQRNLQVWQQRENGQLS